MADAPTPGGAGLVPGEYVIAYYESTRGPAYRRVAYWSGARWHAGDQQDSPALLTPDRVLVGPLPHPEGRICEVDRRVARLEGSLQVADQVACSALERAGIATPAEGYRRAGWSRLGDGIEQLQLQRDRARGHVARLYARLTDRPAPKGDPAVAALYEEAVAALEEEDRTAWWAQVQRRREREVDHG